MKKLVLSLVAGSSLFSVAHGDSVKTVFVIAMENHNWTQPDNQFTGSQQQVYGNPAAPFLTNLINGTLATTVNGKTITSQTAYASAYHNVLSTPTGANPSIHPSEPNYIWSEAGTNFGVFNDNQPYGTGGTNQNTTQHLTGLMQQQGITWKSYQEDIDLVPNSGNVNQPAPDSLTSTVAPQSEWTLPISNFSGTSATYTNYYNGSHQYDYQVKHNPMAFFTDTNGGNNVTSSNPERLQYAPLEQLQTDLKNNTTAEYNWITPDQFNDMHTELSGGFTYNGTHFTGDQAKIAQGDNFLSIIIPQIMASQAYQDHGAIVIWNDETEPTFTGNQNDYNHTIMEIVISSLAASNINGKPFNSTDNLTHSDDLRTMQDIFGVKTNQTATGYLGDAANARGLGSLFTTTIVLNSIECFFNWAENAYSNLFLPAGAFSQFQSPYTYRYYRNTNSYVGVSLINNHVYYLRPDGVLEDVGDLSGWLTTALCQ
ncbi:MAG: alkaline phosphatase family protein [Gammaproteobacteria bacterium]